MSRKRKSRRTVYAAGGAGAALLALLFFQCPGGLGLGGGSSGSGDGSGDTSAETVAATDQSDAATAPADDTQPAMPVRRCQLRLDKTGLSLDGNRTDLDAAVVACQKTGAADLVVTGDASYGYLVAAKKALHDAHVEVYQRH